MRKLFCILLLFLIYISPITSHAQLDADFDLYFNDATLRIDYFHTGNAVEELITIDRIYEQGIWAGNPNRLIDDFNNGKYYAKVYDIASNRLIYSKGFSTIFNEYQTTDPAINGESRTYHNSVLIPFPQKSIMLVIESRNKENILAPIFSKKIDPKDVAIIKEAVASDIRVYQALYSGDPHEKVDLAWIAEGYSEKEYDKFQKDVDRFREIFFQLEPYKSYKKMFNIYGVFRASPNSGVDQPREHVYQNTALNASFNALNLPRYLLTDDNKAMRDIAAKVPYDAIVIMTNSERYGGGGIYNFYAMSTVDNRLSENVFLHEFGHSFAGLGDEYYTSAVVYNEFYPRGVEPTEPNITALLDPEHVKWEELVSPGMVIPTEWGKEEVEELQKKREAIRQKMRTEGEEQEKIAQYRTQLEEINAEIERIQSHYRTLLESKVGVFEGAGYAAQGLYRPEINCLMFSNQELRFCKVCQAAIIRMIDYYTK